MPILSRRSALTGASLAFALGGTRRALAAGPALTDMGPAPEFAGIQTWLNSPPLTMAGLRGKVVLIDFWTYSCINCLRTLPYVTRWYDTYKDKGLVVVGVHTPEFPFERETRNVETAIRRFGIKYPVAQDNAYATWKAYHNEYWPAEYLVDQKGNIVLEHFGEGHYDEMEDAIRKLISAGPPVAKDNGQDLSQVGSPEMYFGQERLAFLASPEKPSSGPQTYTAPSNLPLNHFALIGKWDIQAQNAVLEQDNGAVLLAFKSAKVFIVASSPTPITVAAVVDGGVQPPVTIQASQLYTLFDSTDYRQHFLTLNIPKAGLSAYTFTFG
jgi:thiol-disulfide isomerase/thioredoxin